MIKTVQFYIVVFRMLGVEEYLVHHGNDAKMTVLQALFGELGCDVTHVFTSKGVDVYINGVVRRTVIIGCTVIVGVGRRVINHRLR